MASARTRVAAFWDKHIREWLTGADPLPAPLHRWFAANPGKGLGTVTRDGLPEPYLGDLLGTAGMVVLGLNPGGYVPAFQARDGHFAAEIQHEYGCSYRAWAASGPYVRPPWTSQIGHSKYWKARIAFTRRWLNRPDATHRDLLVFESYPWHSTKITAAMKPEPEIINEFVLEPLAELPVPEVFAFGRAWEHLAQAAGLRCVEMLGHGGASYGSRVASRAVRVFKLTPSQRLVVEWHSGGFGPPSESETLLLRKALK